MLKLYKINDEKISYWETWDKDNKTGLIHWGVIGDKGQSKEIHLVFSKALGRQFSQN